MAEEAVVVEQQTPEQTETPAAPTSENTGAQQDTGHGHRVWDNRKEAWVEPHRDSQGRFASVKANLAKDSFERAQRKNDYLKMLDSGAVELSDDMSPDEWVKARNGMLANKTSGIQPPEPPKEKTPAGSQSETNGTALSDEEMKAFSAYESFMGQLAAKLVVDPEARTAMDGIRTAHARGASEEAISYMGVLIAGTENPDAVFRALGKNPDVIQTYCRLSPAGMATCIKALSQELAQTKAEPEKKQAAPKPAPPAPVGARAASVAFDVNDDQTDHKTWLEQRWKQVKGNH